MSSDLHTVILAGGRGERLWPLSTREHAKQFLSVAGEDSLIRLTDRRLAQLAPAERRWVVCGPEDKALVSRHIPAVLQDRTLVEPEGKNTAPALALAALHLFHLNPEAVMLVCPADHWIFPEDEGVFCQDVQRAVELARSEQALITFGIVPTFPSTGFGYLAQGSPLSLEWKGAYELQGFYEKPDLKTAQSYLRQGGYYWNSGMFVWKVRVFWEELSRCHPALFQLFENLRGHLGKASYAEELQKTFAQAEKISVDYAVMEKARRVIMVSARFSWDDVGNLQALAKLLPEATEGNRSMGQVFSVDSRNNLVFSTGRPVALVGVQGMIVVETPEVVLLLPRERAEEVKLMVEHLKKSGREDLL